MPPASASLDGVLVIDKPQGLTSHDVVAAARRVLRESRIGHTGTLDPLATGVLPLACGRATRLVRFLSSGGKDYEAAVRFGVTTDTCDVTGTVTSQSGEVPTAARIEDALPALRGEYLQEPPAFSAKKVGGSRSYELARARKPVQLPPVPVHVSRADLVALEHGVGRFRISCSAGFYVRSFAHVLGTLVGTGACLEALRRTRSGSFTLDHAIGLDALHAPQDGRVSGLVALDTLLPDMTAVRITDEGRRRVIHGQDLLPAHVLSRQPGASGGEPTGWVRLIDGAGRLVAIGAPRARGALHPSIVLI